MVLRPCLYTTPVVSEPVRACQLIKALDLSGPSFVSSFACAYDCRRTVAKKWYPWQSQNQHIRVLLLYVDIHPVTGNFYSMVDHKSARLYLCADTGYSFTFIHLFQTDTLELTER